MLDVVQLLNLKRALLVAATVAAVALPSSALAADGKCQYGQRTDGTCWDPPPTRIVITITITPRK